MNLELTQDQEFFRDTTRRFIEAEMPLTGVRGLKADGPGFDRGWWVAAAELGWTAMLAGEEAGGGSLSGHPVADAVIVAEEMGRMVTPGPFLPVNVVLAALARHGTATHASAAAALVAGREVAAWALAEPGDRWDPGAVETTAAVAGDEVVLDGNKVYVEAAAAADHLLVVARTGSGLTQVLVPASAPGVTVRPGRSLDLARRFGEVRLDGVRLPASAVVGEVGGAERDVDHLLALAVTLQGAETIGALDRVFGLTLEYMGDRYAFGRPISSYQALKHRVADLLLVLETAKGCVDAAVRALDLADPEALLEASVAKAYLAERSTHLVQECMQFHGGIAVTWEHDLHLYLRRVTVNRVVFGGAERHRERVCSLLGI